VQTLGSNRVTDTPHPKRKGQYRKDNERGLSSNDKKKDGPRKDDFIDMENRKGAVQTLGSNRVTDGPPKRKRQSRKDNEWGLSTIQATIRKGMAPEMTIPLAWRIERGCPNFK